MNDPGTFNPNENVIACENYMSRTLGVLVHFIKAEMLSKSTRDAPWLMVVEVDGERRKYVLRLFSQQGEHEYEVLQAMENLPIPAPRAYGLDPQGDSLGIPSFFYDFIEGSPLTEPMLAGKLWAEDLYIETVCALQNISRKQLHSINQLLGDGETVKDVLEAAHKTFQFKPHPLAEAVYEKLRESMPPLPGLRFSNGDLWPDNLIIRGHKVVGVIDFENAGFSDPIFEFLLPFFVAPELRGRGIEERYCQRMGFDPELLPWYRALEYFDTWSWTVSTGKTFLHYNSDNLLAALENWLSEP